VLLPAAEFLGAEHRAPGRELLEEGALVVLASDANPGTAPVVSMPLVIGLGARMYGMTTRETLAATTLNAAWTLGLERQLGSIEVGKRGDVLVLDGPVERIGYRLGRNPVAMAFLAGEPVYVRDAEAAARISGRGA
jgi:imidazolonepropionase